MTDLPVELRQGHGGGLRRRAGGRARAQHAQLSVRVRRHLHRRRPGDRQPAARGAERQRRRGRLAAARVSRSRGARQGARSAAERGVAAQPRSDVTPRAGSMRPRRSTSARCKSPGGRTPTRGCARRAPAIAFAVNSAACLLDLDGVIIDGSFSRELLRATLARGRIDALDQYSWEGVARPAVLERHHRLGRARDGRRAAAAVRELRARPRAVPEARGVGSPTNAENG